MKVQYNKTEKEYDILNGAASGEVIRPVGSLELYLVADENGISNVFTDNTNIIDERIWNPQNIERDYRYSELIAVVRISDGAIGFMLNTTKIESLDCTLLVEEE